MVALTIILSSGRLEGKILKKMHERIIKNFMDIIIMTELRNGSLSGYDVISYIHNKFNLLVSSGTVYSLLYSLERSGLVEGIWDERKRVYKLTEKGEKTIDTLLSASDKIKGFMANVLKTQNIPYFFTSRVPNRNAKKPLSCFSYERKMHWRARSSVRTEHRTFKLASREIRGSRVQFPSGPPLQKRICADSNRQLPSFSVLNYVVMYSAQIPFLE